MRVRSTTLAGVQWDAETATIPDRCPICHTAVMPRFVGACHFQPSPEEPPHLDVALQCTASECQSMFIGRYSQITSNLCDLYEVWPKSPESALLTDCITSLSPAFVRIYNQGLAAEAFGLDEVVGIALRKALEFLVKDLACLDRPEAAEAIRKRPLAQCIAEYVDDDRIKATASRAVWLGNDETHYVRRWDSHDVEDLKRLVKITLNWVENVLLTRQYTQTMPPPAPKADRPD